jgi:hypothetical protein
MRFRQMTLTLKDLKTIPDHIDTPLLKIGKTPLPLPLLTPRND